MDFRSVRVYAFAGFYSNDELIRGFEPAPLYTPMFGTMSVRRERALGYFRHILLNLVIILAFSKECL